jgi:hypothetical protein
MRKEMFNDYGLKGNSGLTKEYGIDSQIVHVNAPFGINNENEVFVDAFYDGYFEKHKPYQTKKYKYDSYCRMARSEAIKKGYNIIKCFHCNKDAVRLSHSYPYIIEDNACKEHLNIKN